MQVALLCYCSPQCPCEWPHGYSQCLRKGRLDSELLAIAFTWGNHLWVSAETVSFQFLSLHLSSCWNLNCREDRVYVYILGRMWLGREAPCLWILWLILQLYEHFIIDNFVQKEGKVLSLGIPTRDSLRRPWWIAYVLETVLLPSLWC